MLCPARRVCGVKTGVTCSIPQGDYSAMQNRVTSEPITYLGEQGDLYLKQIVAFRQTIESGAPDYDYTEKAVHVQGVVDKIYNEK